MPSYREVFRTLLNVLALEISPLSMRGVRIKGGLVGGCRGQNCLLVDGNLVHFLHFNSGDGHVLLEGVDGVDRDARSKATTEETMQ